MDTSKTKKAIGSLVKTNQTKKGTKHDKRDETTADSHAADSENPSDPEAFAATDHPSDSAGSVCCHSGFGRTRSRRCACSGEIWMHHKEKGGLACAE